MIYLQSMKNSSEKTIKNSKGKMILNSNKGQEELQTLERELLKNKLRKESVLVSENSMEILRELEKI